ncbi:MAG: hypothetical protein HYV27_24865 [Candidatus Hydrogenedentes bacterium]|nr:hypothetical protein [Candidatus Hydrogenedentota bacterium]
MILLKLAVSWAVIGGILWLLHRSGTAFSEKEHCPDGTGGHGCRLCPIAGACHGDPAMDHSLSKQEDRR